MRTIATDVGRTEGPVILQDGTIVFVSRNGRLYKVENGEVGILSEVGHGPNGATEGADGNIYVAQSGGIKHWGPDGGKGGIQIVGRDGSFRWLSQEPLYPNDLCFGPDGFLYVTDPTLSQLKYYDGRLWRIDIDTGEAELLRSFPWFTNGIAFGPDDALYVARYLEQQVMRFTIDGGRLSNGEVFIQTEFGRPDGLFFDIDGNLGLCGNSSQPGSGRRGEIQTFDRNGKLIDVFYPGPNEMYTNAALGPDCKLVISDSDVNAVVLVENWPKPGLPLYPFRKK